MKTVILEGQRVIVAGFTSFNEASATMDAIKGSWPCCGRKRVSYKSDIKSVMVTAPSVSIAQQISEAMRQLFVPVTA